MEVPVHALKTLSRQLLLIACISLACQPLVGGDALAADYSFLGARSLQPGSQTFYATVGVPDLELGTTFGLNSLVDLTPRLRLQFGRGTRVGGGGVAIGAAVRMRLASWGGWMVALVAEPEAQVHLYSRDHPPTSGDEDVQSVAISPLAGGLVIDKEIIESVRFVAGVKVPLTFYVSPSWIMNVPLVAELGCEARIANNLYLVTRIDGGVDFYGPGGAPGTELYFRGRIGLGWTH